MNPLSSSLTAISSFAMLVHVWACAVRTSASPVRSSRSSRSGSISSMSQDTPVETMAPSGSRNPTALIAVERPASEASTHDSDLIAATTSAISSPIPAPFQKWCESSTSATRGLSPIYISSKSLSRSPAAVVSDSS